jgi:hypothetical protein
VAIALSLFSDTATLHASAAAPDGSIPPACETIPEITNGSVNCGTLEKDPPALPDNPCLREVPPCLDPNIGAQVAAGGLDSQINSYGYPPTELTMDGCNHGGWNRARTYLATGPSAYWWYIPFDGNGNPGDSCMMYTYNETSYTGNAYGNAGYWWDNSNENTVDRYLFIFIPDVATTTTNARYQVSTFQNYVNNTLSCGVSQKPYYDQWVQLCGRFLNSVSTVYLDDGTGEPNGTHYIGFDNALYEGQ